MEPTVYIETTIVSYLTAWDTRDVIRSRQRKITIDWWQTQRDRFDLLTSELVILEASAGDAAAAQKRLQVLASLKVADSSDNAELLASALLSAAALPVKASRDAPHVGIAATNGIDYLLTWNCRHLANAELRSRIQDTCVQAGYRAPVIATPEELFEDEYYDRPSGRGSEASGSGLYRCVQRRPQGCLR